MLEGPQQVLILALSNTGSFLLWVALDTHGCFLPPNCQLYSSRSLVPKILLSWNREKGLRKLKEMTKKKKHARGAGRVKMGWQISSHVLHCFPNVLFAISAKPTKPRRALGWLSLCMTMQGEKQEDGKDQ